MGLDEMVDEAWRGFRATLADAIEALPEPDDLDDSPGAPRTDVASEPDGGGASGVDRPANSAFGHSSAAPDTASGFASEGFSGSERLTAWDNGWAHPTSVVVIVDDEQLAMHESPFVKVVRLGDVLEVEVPGNRLLAAHHRLREADKRRLRRLGFRQEKGRGTASRFARFRADQVMEVADLAVTVLRDLFGVLHPSFLDRGNLEAILGEAAGVEPVFVEWVPDDADDEIDEPPRVGAVYPFDLEHLDLLIEDAIGDLIGGEPARDDDDDITLISGTAVIYVHRAAGMPLIRLFSVMVVDIVDRKAADREVGRLNREVDGVKFERRDNQIIASMDLVAQPFVAEHLQMLANHVCRVVSERDGALAEKVQGRVFLDPSHDEA